MGVGDRRPGNPLRPLVFLALALPALLAQDQDKKGAVDAPEGLDRFLVHKHAPGRLLVRFKDGIADADRIAALAEAGAVSKRKIGLHPNRPAELLHVLDVGGAFREKEALATLKNDPRVLYAEPDYLVHKTDTVPADPMFGDLWGLRNTGQTGGTAGADIKAAQAWDLTTGSSTVVIATLDTGVNYNHPDLVGNIWINAAEQAGLPGVDDDGDGYIDDVYGFDFAGAGNSPAEGAQDADPMDIEGHGTHVAGTIGARANNAAGIAGVNWNVKIMAVRFLAPQGGYTSDAVAGYNFVLAQKLRGVNVVAVNNSWSGGGFSQALYDAMKAAGDAGIMTLAAAANGGADQVGDNNDNVDNFPSNFDLDCVIAVAASDHNDQHASFSNYGFNTVDLYAPGVNIASSWYTGGYNTISGTSMATPHVTGVVGLIHALYPGSTIAQVRARLLFSAERKDAFSGRCATGGRLNAYEALEADAVPPGDVVTLAAAYGTPGYSSALLTWTAAGDDGAGGGPVSSLEVRYSTSPITAGNFGSATLFNPAPVPVAAGSPQTVLVSGLAPLTHYWFAVRSLDNVGNASAISNVAELTTKAAGTVLFDDFATKDTAKWTFSSPWGVFGGHATESPAGNYGNNKNISMTSLVGKVNLTGKTEVTLDVIHRYQFEATYDFGYIEISTNGTSWTTLSAYTGAQAAYRRSFFDLTAWQGLPNIQIRFRVKTDNSVGQDGWDIDQAQVLARTNTPPTANALSKTTAEDTPAGITLTGSDPDGSPLTFIVVASPLHGVLSGVAPNLTYSPALNYNGSDSFTYKANDGSADSLPAAVSITVTPVNDAPVAVADAVSTPEDTPISIDVLANDSDVDGDLIGVSLSTNGAHGTTAILGKLVRYTPAADWNGSDSFSYTVSDGQGGTATTTVAVTVTAVNDAPVAQPDAAQTQEDTALLIPVLSNDTDADGDGLTITGVTPGAHGGTLISAGTIQYTPAPNWFGIDGFSYTISDGHGGTSTASVTVTVLPVNDSPVASPDAAVTLEDVPVLIDVLVNDLDVDGDTIALTGVLPGAHGATSIVLGKIQYAPDADWFGSDSFTYTIADGNGGTSTGTVTVTVSSVNDGPVAVADSATTAEDVGVVLPVLANDLDPDGGVLSVTGVTQGSHGTVIVNLDGTLTYTPNANWSGVDGFSYTMSDGQGGLATGLVTVSVTPVNDAPSAADDAASTNEDTPVVVSVLANDGDVEGDLLTIVGVTQGAHGVVLDLGDGTLRYTPAANWNGVDSFTYTVSDGLGGLATATVTVTVNSVNDLPTANAASFVTQRDTPLHAAVTGSDLEGPLSYLVVTAPLHGVLVLNANGTFDYTPAAGYTGPDSFTFQASDGSALSPAATVTLTVNPWLTKALQQDASSDHLLVIEAEHYSNRVDVGGKRWDTLSLVSASNGCAMQALPNTGTSLSSGYTLTSPRLDFSVSFIQTGTYYVWVRGAGGSTLDDSVHVGLDGLPVSSAEAITSFGTDKTLRWSKRGTITPATLSIGTTGFHTINLWMREDGTIVDRILLTSSAGFTPTGLGPAESPLVIIPFQQDLGADHLVVMEAEHYTGRQDVTAKHWDLVPLPASPGETGMQALPNTGTSRATGYVTLSPRLDYAINFATPGTFYVWLRGSAASTTDDSAHVGLDGLAVPTSENIYHFGTDSTPRWSRSTGAGIAVVQVTTPGVHTLNLWMREDGFIVDRLLITTNTAYVPSALGPPESPH